MQRLMEQHNRWTQSVNLKPEERKFLPSRRREASERRNEHIRNNATFVYLCNRSILVRVVGISGMREGEDLQWIGGTEVGAARAGRQTPPKKMQRESWPEALTFFNAGYDAKQNGRPKVYTGLDSYNTGPATPTASRQLAFPSSANRQMGR